MSGEAFLLPLARLLMSSLFIWDGIVQLRNPGGTAQYFASARARAEAPEVAPAVTRLAVIFNPDTPALPTRDFPAD
jgi:uncharacterized membrane protein YphA (DoxX/SURF4 family)